MCDSLRPSMRLMALTSSPPPDQFNHARAMFAGLDRVSHGGPQDFERLSHRAPEAGGERFVRRARSKLDALPHPQLHRHTSVQRLRTACAVGLGPIMHV